LGSPRQERWLDRHLAILAVPVSLGIGGTLDVWAGRVSRAPRVMQTLGLEWCYRLIRQPGRLRRQVVIPQFMATVWRLRAQRRRP
jgi:N-acetylglucosaminyldiphosphoundecaprenol N-acetyl-beta-D-mannosaminyltransferase